MICAGQSKLAAGVALIAAASALASPAPISSRATAANSGIKGFNYGAFFMNQAAKQQADFEYEFRRAQSLEGTSGWSSARLYTCVQWSTADTPIEAFPAAIATNTNLLLGLWVSGSSSAITNEINALKSAISQYGTAFTNLVQGISVGSEDLYRDAAGDPTNPGTNVDNLINYIAQVRAAIAGTPLEGVPIGHVDTYDSFANGTNVKLIDYIDWIGFDAYPFWEVKNANAIENAHDLFFSGLDKTNAIAKGKPVYVTETGWPATGDNQGAAVPSVENARTYWEQVACQVLSSNINLWYYDLQESQYGTANPDFGVFPAGDLFSVSQRYSLSC